eukprot:Clim_evm80s134 gene=Clim_evmTU80s134
MSDKHEKKRNVRSRKDRFKTVKQKQKILPPEGDPLWQALCWGVETSMVLASRNMNTRLLLKEDFNAHRKTTSETKNYNPQALPSNFVFKEYAPLVFHVLREKYDVEATEVIESLTEGDPTREESYWTSAPAYITFDRRFCVNIVDKDDFSAFLEIIQPYHDHVVQCEGRTLLPAILGAYRLHIDSKEFHIMIHRNVCSGIMQFSKIFFLKGSTVGREADKKDKEKPVPRFKDKDFVQMGSRIFLGEERRDVFLDILKEDVTIMQKLNIMDYSIMVGVVEYDQKEEPEIEEDIDIYAVHSLPVDKREIYFMGIVDVYTHYGVRKHAAHAGKSIRYGDGAGISSVDPGSYAKRLVEFMENVVV